MSTYVALSTYLNEIDVSFDFGPSIEKSCILVYMIE